MPFTHHEDYFATFAPEVSARLVRIQQQVERNIPGAVRCIGYNMPAFRQQRIFFYFAAFKNHVGVYPPVTADTADTAIIAATAQFRGPKGNLSFPHTQQLPLDLIGKVAVALAAQYARP
jgi:uncharacterized protein YdhG (YjbR/CyaY superfamily)